MTDAAASTELGPAGGHLRENSFSRLSRPSAARFLLSPEALDRLRDRKDTCGVDNLKRHFRGLETLVWLPV